MPTIFRFASGAPNSLFAFAGDRMGSSLPARHGPWKSEGNIGPREAIPHQLDRKHIEDAIDEHGYQLWRMKKEA